MLLDPSPPTSRVTIWIREGPYQKLDDLEESPKGAAAMILMPGSGFSFRELKSRARALSLHQMLSMLDVKKVSKSDQTGGSQCPMRSS
jgi:hypothetical protein